MEIGMAIEHKITITPTQNMGFVVKIGCGTFCASNKLDLIRDLDIYFSDPNKYEKAYSNLETTREDVRERRTLTSAESENIVREDPLTKKE